MCPSRSKKLPFSLFNGKTFKGSMIPISRMEATILLYFPDFFIDDLTFLRGKIWLIWSTTPSGSNAILTGLTIFIDPLSD